MTAVKRLKLMQQKAPNGGAGVTAAREVTDMPLLVHLPTSQSLVDIQWLLGSRTFPPGHVSPDVFPLLFECLGRFP